MKERLLTPSILYCVHMELMAIIIIIIIIIGFKDLACTCMYAVVFENSSLCLCVRALSISLREYLYIPP